MNKEKRIKIFEWINFKPQEIVLIDDNPSSIKTAKQLGFNVIMYKNNKQLNNEFERFGVKYV